MQYTHVEPDALSVAVRVNWYDRPTHLRNGLSLGHDHRPLKLLTAVFRPGGNLRRPDLLYKWARVPAGRACKGHSYGDDAELA